MLHEEKKVGVSIIVYRIGLLNIDIARIRKNQLGARFPKYHKRYRLNRVRKRTGYASEVCEYRWLTTSKFFSHPTR